MALRLTVLIITNLLFLNFYFVADAESKKTDIWKDPVTGMEFVWIPGGCFQMGETPEEKAWLINDVGQKNYDNYHTCETPRHEVCVDGFYMGRFEVTRGQFRQFVAKSGYQTDAQKKGKASIKNQSTGWAWKKVPGYDWRNVGYFQDDRHPVTTITWYDASAFSSWLSRKSGGTFRLPTEAEWEYAARANSTGKWFWGDDPSLACNYANVADTTPFPGSPGKRWPKRFECSDGYWGTSPVGSFLPNDFGLYDMAGNAWEWCADIYDGHAYSKSSRSNPIFSSGSSNRVYRGGSWYNCPRLCRSAHRLRREPGSVDYRLGFRLVRTK